ncbi:MAG: VCBS repeat-containing protein [Kiritimatiellae bacterium]|nr:VCBS repeat-containing protein [Kiritimatiellia bacterium]
MKRINSLWYILAMTALGLALTAKAATIRVTGGAWYLGNKLTATNFILASAATMIGNGEVRAPATLAGTVSPGSSTADIGNLSFSDRVAFDSGSFVCYAATDTSLDRISVTGDVTGAATVRMTRAADVAPLRQIIIKGGTISDYDSFEVYPSTEWALGEMNTLDLIVSFGQLPSVPQNVSASDGTYFSKVAVSWSAASGVSEYQVWRNTVNNSSSATLLGTTAQTSYNDADSAVAVLYYYWIKATNTIGASAFSSSDSGWRAGVSSGVCADYDGDGKADPAVYDEATGTWKVKLSSSGYYMIITTLSGLGGPGYASVSADYDGDRKADPAVYHELTGHWAIMLSSANYEVVVVLTQPLGGSGYSGMPADYDGDAKADPGVYQREQGDWQVMLSSAGYSSIELLGLLGGTGYQAVAADYDGDGIADPAVYGEATGDWKIMLSGADYWTLTLTGFLGGTGYVPVPADYDGDGLADPAVKSETSNEWIVMFSSGDYTPVTLTISFE